jgi:hypothetical protein
MHWTAMMRRSGILAAGTAVLLAAACGGGDNHPTGPGGGGMDTYDLVALGHAGLPADAELEDCMLTRFYSGGLQVDAVGNWQILLQVHDESGDWGYMDQGQVEVDGTTVWFDSQVSGVSYQGAVDGTEVRIMYDWCANGVPDVQLVFDQ